LGTQIIKINILAIRATLLYKQQKTEICKWKSFVFFPF